MGETADVVVGCGGQRPALPWAKRDSFSAGRKSESEPAPALRSRPGGDSRGRVGRFPQGKLKIFRECL